MVVSEAFIWLHIPKTAGDATLAMFQALGRSWVLMDEHTNPLKHGTLAEAAERVPGLERLRVVANLRRLPEVALSYYHHMQRHGPDQAFADGRRFGDLRFADYLRYVIEHPETQTYDWILDHHLGDREPDHWLLVSRLAESFLEVVGRYHAVAPDAAARIRGIRANVGPYERGDLRSWYARDEMEALYRNSPRWERSERAVYGDRLVDVLDWAGRPAPARGSGL